jgi:hypothetical protein
MEIYRQPIHVIIYLYFYSSNLIKDYNPSIYIKESPPLIELIFKELEM